jgi:hypothetical protein
MADPVSVTGLCLQIGGVIAKVYKYSEQVKGAKKEIRELLVEILALKAVLEQVEVVRDASSLRSSPSVQDALAATKTLLDNILKSLEDKQGKARRAFQLLSWPETRSTMQQHIARIERMKSCFSLLLTNETSTRGQEMIIAIQNISTTVDEDRINRRVAKQQKLHQNIRSWISPACSDPIHRRALASRQPDTGKWFLEGIFQQWLNSEHCDSQILFITGSSGCGKTTLCSAAIENVHSLLVNSDLPYVLYFHCSYEVCSSRPIETILGSFVSQLSDQDPEILDDLKAVYERRDRPTADELLEALIKHIKVAKKVYVFLDAINESIQVEAVAKTMLGLADRAANASLMITSTHLPTAFDTLLNTKLTEVVLKKQLLQPDIELFVTSQVKCRESFNRLSECHKDTLKQQVVEKADGMYVIKLHSHHFLMFLVLNSS